MLFSFIFIIYIIYVSIHYLRYILFTLLYIDYCIRLVSLLTLFGPGYFGVGKDRGGGGADSAPPLITHEIVMVSP